MTHTYGWEANEPVFHGGQDFHYVQRIADRTWEKRDDLLESAADNPDWQRIQDMGLMASLCEDIAGQLYDLNWRK